MEFSNPLLSTDPHPSLGDLVPDQVLNVLSWPTDEGGAAALPYNVCITFGIFYL